MRPLLEGGREEQDAIGKVGGGGFSLPGKGSARVARRERLQGRRCLTRIRMLASTVESPPIYSEWS